MPYATNSGNGYVPQAIQDFTVYVSAQDPTLYTFEDWAENASVWKHQASAMGYKESLTIPVNTIGRYVRIQLSNADDFNPMYIAEVTVSGTPIAAVEDDEYRSNIAADKSWQTNIDNTGPDNALTDGVVEDYTIILRIKET